MVFPLDFDQLEMEGHENKDIVKKWKEDKCGYKLDLIHKKWH